MPPYSVSGMVPSSSLIPRPTVFPDFLINYWHSNENKRNSSGDEIANVNFLYDDIVHAVQNKIDLCIGLDAVMC